MLWASRANGPIGLVLVIAALGAPLLAIRRGKGPVLAATGGAYVAFLVHAGIDWDWEVPAVTLSGLFCGTVLVVGNPRGRVEMVSVKTKRALFAPAGFRRGNLRRLLAPAPARQATCQ
jgi:hypothetical protein